MLPGRLGLLLGATRSVKRNAFDGSGQSTVSKESGKLVLPAIQKAEMHKECFPRFSSKMLHGLARTARKCT